MRQCRQQNVSWYAVGGLYRQAVEKGGVEFRERAWVRVRFQLAGLRRLFQPLVQGSSAVPPITAKPLIGAPVLELVEKRA